MWYYSDSRICPLSPVKKNIYKANASYSLPSKGLCKAYILWWIQTRKIFQRNRFDLEIYASLLEFVLHLHNVFERKPYCLFFLIHVFCGCSILVFTGEKKKKNNPKCAASQNKNCHKQQSTEKPCAVLCRLMGSGGSIRYFQKTSQFQLSVWLLTVHLSVVLLYTQYGVSASAPLLVVIVCWHVNHLPHEIIGNPLFPQFIFKISIELGCSWRPFEDIKLNTNLPCNPKPAKKSNHFPM